MRYLIDSSAWIEYLDGGASGEKVNKIIKEENNEIITLALNISEVISKTKRMNRNADLAYESIISNAEFFDITPEIAKEAGLLHSQLRKQNQSISIADTLMMISSEALSARIVTKDNHFKNFKGVVLV